MRPTGLLSTAAIVLGMCLCAGSASATDSNTYWTATSGDWSDANNWTLGEPNVSQSAVISNGGTAAITQPGETCNYLYLGNQAGQTGIINQTSGTLVSSQTEYVGYSGSGLYAQSDGNHTVAGSLYLGYNSGSDGNYYLSGSGRLTADNEFIGFNGAGVFTQSGGTNTVTGSLQVGQSYVAWSTYRLTGTGVLTVNPGGALLVQCGHFEWFGGTITAPNMTLLGATWLSMGFDFDAGSLANGSLTHGNAPSLMGALEITNGATATQGGDSLRVGRLFVGSIYGTPGSYVLNGPGSLTVGSVSGGDECVGCGVGTVGTFTQSDGNHTILSGNLYVGAGDHSSGSYDLHGTGRLTVNGAEYVGDYSTTSCTGTFTQTDGDNTAGSLIVIGGAGSFSSYSLSGNGRLLVGSESIGGYSGGTGTFTQSDGNHTVLGSLTVANPGTGSYVLDGPGRLTIGTNLYLGYFGTAIFTQTDGNNTVLGSLYIARLPGRGNYQLGGNGRLSVAGCAYTGYLGEGDFVQSGGNHSVDGNLCLGTRAGARGWYLLSDGNLAVGYGEYVGDGGEGAFTQNGGTHAIADTLSVGNADGNGTYVLSGGQLTVPRVTVGPKGTFTFSGGSLTVQQLCTGSSSGGLIIADANAAITVSKLLSIGAGGSLSAATGSTIHMTGSAFENRSTDANLLAGMSNLRLIYERLDANGSDPFEVAGLDIGADANGFLNNFGLAALQLGGDGGAGNVFLVDLFDNQPDFSGPEALYLQSLTVNPGSELYLNGVSLYVNGVQVSAGDGGLYGGGVISALPEPATLALLALGGLALLRRRRR